MEGVLALMVFLFGAMLLIMFLGYRSIEVERASNDAQISEHPQVLNAPRFFANLAPAAPTEGVPGVPAYLIERLEQRLRGEYASAAQFASQSSKERICPDYSAYVDALAGEPERHIQRETAATSAFAAQPSVERLYDDAGPPVGLLLRRQHATRESALVARAERARS